MYRLRLGVHALTREPDTVSTVVGKDAYMGFRWITLHLGGCNVIQYFFRRNPVW